MTGFFKKLFNRVTGRGAAEPEAPAPAAPEPVAEPVAEPIAEPVVEPVTEAVAESAAPVAAPKPRRTAAKPTVKTKPRPRPRPVEAGAPAPAAAVAEALPPPMEILPEPLPLAAAEVAAVTVPPPPLAAEAPAPRRGWFARLRQGLAKSSRSLSSGIADIFTKRKLDAATLEELEDVLIQADLGVDMASRITQAVAKGRYEKEIEPVEVRRILAAQVEKVLHPVEVPFTFSERERPFVVLVVGVNGSGKTTTIGKLGAIAVEEGYSVMLAACDTFRAAAIEQLEVWGERIGARVVSRPTGADASGLAFDAFAEARREGTDIVFIDTAGRLQNKAVLMAELEKIVRVIKKQDASAPHAVLLVLDATTGQNAIAQAEVFTRIAGVTGIVMTKLDGTARGGILVAIAERFQLPVHAIGVGEGVKDLQPFDAALFARAIAGLDEEEAA